MRALEQQAAQVEVVEADRRAGQVLQRDAVAALAVAQSGLGGAARGRASGASTRAAPVGIASGSGPLQTDVTTR